MLFRSTALIAYLGFLIGPLVLGTIGSVFSIRMSIVVIALVVLSIQLIAGVLRQSNATPSAEPIHAVSPADIIEQAA